MGGSKCIYFSFVRKNGELESFAQSIIELTALDSSEAQSCLFQCYLGYTLITLILCAFSSYYSISNKPTKNKLASSICLRKIVEKGKCYKYKAALPAT